MSQKPFCIVTKSGQTVNMSTLQQYSLKESKQVPEDSWRTQYSGDGVVKPMYGPDALLDVLDANTYHNRCCKVKARDTAGLGWALTAIGDDASDMNHRILQDFFGSQADLISEILYRYQYDQEAIGFSALEVVRENGAHDGRPIEIHHAPAHTMRRHGDRMRVLQRRGSKKRWFRLAGVAKDVDFETGKIAEPGALKKDRRASEIIWGVNYDARSEFYGSPDFIPALGTISADYFRREYNRTFFENYGIPSYACFITGNYDAGPEDENGKTELEKKIQEHFSEIAKNPHQTLILSMPTRGESNDIKIEFRPLGVEVKEASFRLFRKDNRDEIIVAHGVAAYRIGVLETGQLAGNLGVEARENYKGAIIEPRQGIIEDMINLHIIRNGFGVEDWTWELAEIDTTDEKHEIELQAKLVDNNAMTRAELRGLWADRFGLEHDMPEESSDSIRYAVVGMPALVQGGVITLNEARHAIGLPSVGGGDALLDPRDEAIGQIEKALKAAAHGD